MKSNSLLLNGKDVKRSFFSKYTLLDQENKLLKARVKELEEKLLGSRSNLQEAKPEKRVEKALEHTASVQKKIHSKAESKRKQMDEGKVMALRKAGWTYAKIADEMGYSYSSIYFAVQKLQKEGKL